MVAIDVEAFYELGVGVVGGFIQERDRMAEPYNKFILELLQFILSNNVILFGCSHYLQVQGVAMGTICTLGGCRVRSGCTCCMNIVLLNIYSHFKEMYIQ